MPFAPSQYFISPRFHESIDRHIQCRVNNAISQRFHKSIDRHIHMVGAIEVFVIKAIPGGLRRAAFTSLSKICESDYLAGLITGRAGVALVGNAPRLDVIG
jgi:hypothetical protein